MSNFKVSNEVNTRHAQKLRENRAKKAAKKARYKRNKQIDEFFSTCPSLPSQISSRTKCINASLHLPFNERCFAGCTCSNFDDRVI